MVKNNGCLLFRTWHLWSMMRRDRQRNMKLMTLKDSVANWNLLPNLYRSWRGSSFVGSSIEVVHCFMMAVLESLLLFLVCCLVYYFGITAWSEVAISLIEGLYELYMRLLSIVYSRWYASLIGKSRNNGSWSTNIGIFGM